jgi:hypothetical protein
MPKQDVGLELYYDGTWHNLVPADDVLISEPIKIMRGDSDESAAPRPASVSCRLNNDDDMYRTSNPESPLYGKAGLNTPLRASVRGKVRGTVEASEWAADQTRDFRATPKRGSAWVDVEGGGLLQRVGQWTEQLASPFRQFNQDEYAAHAVGYFPLEDPAGTLTPLTTVPGATSRFAADLDYGNGGRFAGSGPLAQLGAGVAANFNFVPTGLADSGYQLSWTSRHEQVFASGNTSLMNWTATNGYSYSVSFAEGTSDIRFIAVDTATSTTVVDTTLSVGSSLDYNVWTMFRVKVTSSGGTVSVEFSWIAEGSSTFLGTTWTHSGTTGALKRATIGTEDSGDSISPKYGHILGLSTGADDLESGDRVDAFNGHDGETAGARFARLMTLKGLAYSIVGTSADSARMGPQGVDTFAEQLREIRDTEDGLIYDDIDAIALVFLLRNARYNQTPALTLNAADPDASGLPNLPTEVTDDLGVHNVVTASQRDGGEYTAEDSTSPMGSQPPPVGRGEYKQTKNVNVADPDNDLLQQAGWWLKRGTVNLPRFPQVVVNLAALDASKIAEVERVDVGSVIAIVGYREYTIRLYVIGYTEVIGTHSRMLTFTCAPDQQFQAGVYGGDARYTPRYDLRTCTLSADVGPTATTLAFSFVRNEKWSQTQSYDLLIAGELIGVPAGGMGAQSGSGPFAQTLTGAVRSKNGIRKTLKAGTEVHIATPGRWGL